MFSDDCIKQIVEMDFPIHNNRELAASKLKAYTGLVTKFIEKARNEGVSNEKTLGKLWDYISKETTIKVGTEVIVPGAWDKLYQKAKSKAMAEAEKEEKGRLVSQILTGWL